MYYWLERETQLLKELGDYKVENQNNLNNAAFSFDTANQEILSIANYPEEVYMDIALVKEKNEEPSLLHEQVLKDQKTFQEKIFRLKFSSTFLNLIRAF